MMRTHETEVLVVGAGPVGLLTALLLTERGIPVQIIDQQWRTAVHSYACALHPYTLKLMDQLGLGGAVLERGRRVDRLAFYAGETRCAELQLNQLAAEFPYLLVLPQSEFEELLERRLAEHHVPVHWNHRLARLEAHPDYVVAHVDKLHETSKGYIVAEFERAVERNLSLRAQFLVGADGHNSVTRQLLGIELEKYGQPQIFEVFEFDTDAKLSDEVRVVLDGGLSVMWPLPGQCCRWSFQMVPAVLGDDYWDKDRLPVRFADEAFDPKTLRYVEQLIQKHAPWFAGRVQEMDWSVVIQFQQRLARRYGQERCWLAGDAAHQTGPVGAQSVNIGLREAEEVANKIAGILRANAPVSTLEHYGQARHADWERLLASGGPRATDRANPWVKRHAAEVLPCVPAAGEDLSELLGQIGLEL